MEPEDGERDGQFPADGINAAADATEGIHVAADGIGIHLIKLGHEVRFREWRADCCREGRPDFLDPLSFLLICARYGGLADVDARTGLEAKLRGWRAAWERLVVERLLAMGCLGASVAVWI